MISAQRLPLLVPGAQHVGVEPAVAETDPDSTELDQGGREWRPIHNAVREYAQRRKAPHPTRLNSCGVACVNLCGVPVVASVLRGCGQWVSVICENSSSVCEVLLLGMAGGAARIIFLDTVLHA